MLTTQVNIRAIGVRQNSSHPRLCYTSFVREKEFINKVHKHLPKEVYRWKINDPYHGGVPDAFYSGIQNHCFVEYKYKDTLPKKLTSKIKLELSAQQRNWLKLQKTNNLFVYTVFACQDHVYVIEDFDLKEFTVADFYNKATTFKEYIFALTKFCMEKYNEPQ